MYEFRVFLGGGHGLNVEADSVSISSGVAMFHGDDGHFVAAFHSYEYILRGDKIEPEYPDADTLAVPPIDENDWGKPPFDPAEEVTVYTHESGWSAEIVEPKLGLEYRVVYKGFLEGFYKVIDMNKNRIVIANDFGGIVIDRAIDHPISSIFLSLNNL